MEWDENKHPRDKDGKFTDGTSLAKQLTPNSEIEKLKTKSIEDLKAISRLEISNKRVLGSGKEVNAYFDTKAQKAWENSLTKEQKGTIYNYTDKGYEDINTLLRYNVVNSISEEKSKLEHNIKLIDEALEKSILHEPLQIYRAVDSSIFYWDKDISELNGTIFNDKAFMSSTPTLDSESLTQDTLLIITVPKGIGNGAYINNLSKYKNQEYEFLLPRNRRFKIVKAYDEGRTHKIEMEMQND